MPALAGSSGPQTAVPVEVVPDDPRRAKPAQKPSKSEVFKPNSVVLKSPSKPAFDYNEVTGGQHP
jgi:hypothetical protein